MRLEQSFEVPVPVAQAWGFLLDVEQIAPCMPGATLTGYDGTAFTGLVKVKLGPVVMSFKGNGRFVERDEAAHRVVLVASGQETKGAGAAQARVTAVLHSDRGGAATQVKVVADVDIAGRAAQFGRGMIADVNRRLVEQFAACLAKTIAALPVAPVAPAASAEAALVEAAPAEAAAPAAEAAAQSAAPGPAAAPPAAAPPAAAPPAAAPPAAAPADAPVAGAAALGTAPAAEVAPSVAEATAPDPGAASPAAAPQPPPLARPIEGEPIDLLAVSGAKGMARRAGPIIAVILIIVVAVIVYFALS
jgi:uncharacterized protein